MAIMMRESSVKEVVMPIEAHDLPLSIPMDLVVTITKSGKPLSRFRDDIWDYSATSASLKTINFRSKVQSVFLQEEHDIKYSQALDKAITVYKEIILHWISIIGGCSISKLNGDATALSYLVAYQVIKENNFLDIFSDPMSIDFMIKHISTEKQTGVFLAKIQRFIDIILTHNENPFWSKYQPSNDFLIKLRNSRKIFPETTESTQTLLIPSNIYQCFLKKIIEDLTLFIEFKEKINYVFVNRALARDQGVGVGNDLIKGDLTRNQQNKTNYYWQCILKKDPELRSILNELLDKGISRDNTWSGIVRSLGFWQTRSAVLIAAFTGMRRNEILAIPFNGLSYLDTDKGNIPVVWSTTTKLEEHGVPKFTKWVTSSIVQLAFDVSRVIAMGILKFSGSSVTNVINERSVPLFLSSEQQEKRTHHPSFDFSVTTLGLDKLIKEYYQTELTISEGDVEELRWFLYGEDSALVVKGSLWPLTLHQFRRSLAVYAAGSGNVSYPTLKAQLKHISMVMTAYYADSNSRAIDILSNKDGVNALKSEWLDARARVESDHIYDLVNSDIALSGVAGKRLSVQKLKKELPAFLTSRKETAKAVKNGKIRYRPTMVGGCMSPKPCNKGAGVLASACVSCENAVFLPSSIEALKQTKEFYQDQLQTTLPSRARNEYELNIKRIDSFMQNIVGTMGNEYEN